MTNRTVLIVDDDITNRRSAKVALRRLGWDVLIAGDPKEAADLPRPDVALLDWQPHGPAMVEVCKQNGIPFVIWTGLPGAVPREYKTFFKLDQIRVVSEYMEGLCR